MKIRTFKDQFQKVKYPKNGFARKKEQRKLKVGELLKKSVQKPSPDEARVR